MTATDPVSGRNVALNLAGNEKNDEDGKGVSKKGIDKGRGVKPTFGRTGVGHPVVARKGESEQREPPKHQNGIDSRELTFRCREDRDDPFFILSEFPHPAQLLEVCVEFDQVVMDGFVGGCDLPSRPAPSIFPQHIDVFAQC